MAMTTRQSNNIINGFAIVAIVGVLVSIFTYSYKQTKLRKQVEASYCKVHQWGEWDGAIPTNPEGNYYQRQNCPKCGKTRKRVVEYLYY
jgi:hypothetical protein